MKDFAGAEGYIKNRLQTELPAHLHYHSYEHTIDVVSSALQIAEKEHIHPDDMKYLRLGAWWHDSGFILDEKNHEWQGCEIAKAELPRYGFNQDDIEIICGLIMATRVPQSPQNRLEEILCDADLDYLGREDFFIIGRNLFKEWTVSGFVKSETHWNEIQVRFLSAHHYFTHTSRTSREMLKQEHLRKISELLHHPG